MVLSNIPKSPAALAAAGLAVALLLGFALNPTPTFAGKPPCKKNCGPVNTYTAKLDGAFMFALVEDLTLNKQENILRSSEPLTLFRPDESRDSDAWDAVFEACENLFGAESIFKFSIPDMFTLDADEWEISKSGGVRVAFLIEGDSFNVAVQLIGDEFDFDETFLPELDGESREYVLTQFQVTGTPVRGKGAIKSCRGSAGGGILGFIDGSGTFIPSPSTLVITASVPE